MKTKRLTALLISVLMILQMFAVSASAAYIGQVDDPADIKFVIPSAETTWTADGVIAEGEYGKIDVKTSHLSVAAATDEAAAMAITTPISLHMSYDENYVYIAATTSAANYVCDIDNSNASNMWAAHAVQLSLADINATESDERLETGYALSSLDGNMYTCTWFDPMDVGYNADGNGDFTVVNNGNELVYEMRVPFEAFVGKKLVDGDAFLGSVIWAVGTSKDGGSDAYTHIQLGYGVSGDPGKTPTGHATFYLGHESESDVPSQSHGSKVGDIPKLSADTSLTIDGQMDDAAWADALTVEINQFKAGVETGTHGKAHMLWDDNVFYIYYDISDAEIVIPSEDAQKNTPWTTDSVEMFFDFGGNHEDLVRQFRIDFAGWLSYYAEGGGEAVYGPEANAYFGDYAVSMDKDGYNIEAAVNLEQWGLVAGEKIGLQLQINDMTSQNEYGTTAVYNMVQSLGAGSWDADLYDYVVLGGDGSEPDAPAVPTGRQNKNVVFATPEIDGVLNDGEWNNDSSIVINEENGVAWAGETISDVVFYQAWDDNGLYLAGGIEDDDLCLAPSIENVYNLDALQFALDPAGLIGNAGGGGGMFFSVGPMEDGTLGAVYHPYGGAAEAFDYTGAYSVTENGWQFEIMIPWTSVEVLEEDGFAWTHAANEVIDALFCVLDRDEEGAVANCYMTAIDELSFTPADYPYALKLAAKVETPTQTNHGNAAYVTAGSITVDGTKDDAYVNVTPIAVKYENGKAVADMTDGTANVYLATNNGLLYVYAEVNDTEIVAPTEQQHTEWPWATDSLEMFVYTSGNTYQFRVDNMGYPSFYLNPNGVIAAYGYEAVKDYFVSYASGVKVGGYTVEYCIDLKNFGISSGTELGINFQLNDRAADDSQRTIFNSGAGSWDAHLYDTITVGADESYEAVKDLLPTSGTCGENLTWTLEDGILTISGTGEMGWDPLGSVKSAIKSVVIEDGVTTIGGYAFYGCENLTSVTLPDSVTVIRDSAFRACPALTEIVIPDSVETIELYAFENCAALKSVTLGSGITKISDSAFRTCTALKEIVIPNSVTTIEVCAFQGCAALESVVIGDSVTVIGDAAFLDCTALKSLTIGNAVTNIVESAFRNCTALTEVIIPDSVTEIGIWAFAGCTSLETLVLGDNLTKIGECAFRDNTSLKTVVIPKNVTEIGVLAFFNCTSLESVVFEDCNPVVRDWAFQNCTALRYADLGNALTELGVGMFCDCINLEALYFTGNAPTVIGNDAFWNTPSNVKWYYYEGTEGWTTPIWVGSNGHGYTTEMLPAGTDIPVDSDSNISDLATIPFVDENAIVVDGVKDSAYSNGAELLINNRHADSGNTGALASASMLTNNGLVYLYVDVVDPQIVEPTPEIQANAPWTADSVEFLFHANNNVHQFRVDVSDYLSYYRNQNGIIQAYGADAEKYFVAHNVVPTENGYAIEFCIDTKMFGVSSGETIAIQMQLNDMTADGGWSCYNYRATDHAFTVENFDDAQIGIDEKYKGQLEMLGSNIGEVPYIKPGSIEIDGQYSSVWDNALKVEIDQFNYGDENAPTGGTAYMYWTEGKWYLFVDVKDADVVTPDPEMQASAPWVTDSVELFFDFGHEHSELVKQFRIDCSGYPSYYVEDGSFWAYGNEAKEYFDKYVVAKDADGYNIEMVVNLAKFGLTYGDEIGLQLQINDVVSANPADVYSCWNMHQSKGAGSWDADLYDYVTLEAPEIIKVEIPVTENKETTSVEVKDAVVQGSTVTVKDVNTDALANVFNTPATEPDVGEDTGNTETTPAAPANTVTIDVSNVKSEGAEEAEKVQQVTIPAAVVDTIKTAAETNNVEDAKLAVHLSTGSIIMDKATLEVINKTAEAEEGKTTTVSLVIDDAGDSLNETQESALENVAEDEIVFSKLEIAMEVTKVDDVTGDAESEKIHDFEGGTVQLEVPFEIPEGLKANGFTVYYLDEDGNLIAMDTQYVDGKIVWTTGHFSDYIIMYKEPTDKPADEPTKEPIKSNADEIVDGFFDMVKDVSREILTYEPFYDGTFHLQTAIKDIVNNTAGSVLDWAVKSIKTLGFWLF